MSFILVKHKKKVKKSKKLKEKEIKLELILHILEMIATLLLIISYLIK